jgi:hypothetical protein
LPDGRHACKTARKKHPGSALSKKNPAQNRRPDPAWPPQESIEPGKKSKKAVFQPLFCLFTG